MTSPAMTLRQTLIGVLILVLLMSGLISLPALAVTNIRLSDLSYKDCPAKIGEGAVTSGGGTMRLANCFMVTGKAENPSQRTVMYADIFGRIYDANNNPVMENRGRLGSIEEVPPGVSTFELRISVPEGLALPLELKQFKASGFAGKVR